MPLEEDISSFINWATNFGFLLEDLPSKDALKSIFKSPQRDLFYNLIERVKPLKQCKAYRDNILIENMDKMLNQVDPICNRKFLPKEMQRYIRIEELKKIKSDAKTRNTELRSEYEKLSGSIKIKNIQKIKMKNNQELLRAKVNTLKLKNKNLTNMLAKEEDIKEKIIAAMPVRIATGLDGNDLNFITEALKDIDNFYNVYLSSSNPHVVQYATNNLWKKLRKTFSGIPDFMIFDEVLRLKEDQLQDIMALNKSTREDSNKSTVKDSINPFELEILKSKTSLLGIIMKYAAVRKEEQLLEHKFQLSYNKFVKAVQNKINLYNSDINEDTDIIFDFICQNSTRNFNKRQNEYLVKEIERLQSENQIDLNQLKNHSMLLSSITQVYSEINTSVNRIQYEIIQLNQIKDKIVYSKQLLHYMLSEIKDEQQKLGSTKLRTSRSGADSFEMSNENVFSSTKVDFESTFNSTMARSCDLTNLPQARSILPSYVHEILTFIETPMERFNCVPKECAFYLSPNPLIIESKELSSTIQLVPGILLTPYGAIQEIKSFNQWYIKIMNMPNYNKINFDLPQIDANDFKKRIKQQNDQITELLDKIDVTGINTKRSLEKVSKYYNFLLNNPMRNYVPRTKLFNNQSYVDYESEYMMYYRMASK